MPDRRGRRRIELGYGRVGGTSEIQNRSVAGLYRGLALVRLA